MDARRKLFRLKDAYSDNGDLLFVNAMKEICKFEYEHCQEYAELCRAVSFKPDDIVDMDSLALLPVIPTLLFKKHTINAHGCGLKITSTSSGTHGNASVISFDLGGLLCGLNMVLRLCRRHKVLSARPVRYIVMGNKMHKDNKTAVTKTAFGATFFAPALSRRYALKYSNGKYSADLSDIIQEVIQYSHGKAPVRFMGFPSYTYFMLSTMAQKNISVRLPKGSMILLAGGWKQFYTQQVDKAELYTLAKNVLGIEESMITEFYGAVEHPIMYTDCKNHHFHVPAYSRVFIRDVDTLKPLGFNQIGIVNLLTPMVKSTPLLSVMTDDLGILHPPCECDCGINTPFLEIIGRCGLQDIKTCAAGAAEILKKTEF
ncbi:MAG: acyl-protein synthetase [Clostridia bacterium]|nr:acyl-protein synthetase [Clostridia bacterium]